MSQEASEAGACIATCAALEEIDDDVSQQEVDAAWDQEIARRVQSVQAGTAVLHDWDDVEREADRILDE